MRIVRTCFLLSLLAGAGGAGAQEGWGALVQNQMYPRQQTYQAPSAVTEANCTVHALTARITEERVAALVCTGPNITSAFRLDLYGDGTARLHLFDFSSIDPAADAVQYRVGVNDVQSDNNASRILSAEYARTLELDAEAYNLFVGQMLDKSSFALNYQIEGLPVRSVPLPANMEAVLGTFQAIQAP